MQYHLVDRVGKALDEMLANDVVEEHPRGEPAPWTSNVVVANKDDGEIRITMDAKNLNKALKACNFPIPRQEDIKAKLGGSKMFSKLDLKSAYWQLEIDPECRELTTFHCNGRLYRYKRLVMGLKCAQGELNAALQPLFSHMKDVHVIHDDIVIGTVTVQEHAEVLEEVLRILSANGLTLNQEKCVVGAQQIKFWGLMFGVNGISPDPEKVEALAYITPPTNKDELKSFLCMMQANSEFIERFAVKAAKLRELTKRNVWFKWTQEHQDCFDELVQSFKEDTLLRYFDLTKKTFVKVDAHKKGLSAILAQGDSLETSKPVAVASRCTSVGEKSYPQLDLEAMSVDFGLRRFREYLVGSPNEITIVTDHKPLLSIFNNSRRGSIRSQRIKLNHQDIPYKLIHCKGSSNQADYMTKRSKPLSKLPKNQRKEPEELNNLLYMLHVTPVIDHIGLGSIAVATAEDPVLKKIQSFIREGVEHIPKGEEPEVWKFNQILPELMIAGNGIIFKDDRIVLPKCLQVKAMELAHRGMHSGQSGLERRLRYHFFFHNMFQKTQKFLQNCEPCLIFDRKKTKEPITPHTVPTKCWEKVSVDLFGPIPSRKHVVVVQDLSSRYPEAKLVKSTKAESVLPVLERIYDVYGNPRKQISDNGPPFNGKKMEEFAERRDIGLQFIPPLHPNGNPVETFMKPLGKALKIGHYNKASEEQTLKNALKAYRQTPHPSTGLPPDSMIFRDGVRNGLPRKSITDEEVRIARERDEMKKEQAQTVLNSSKYRKASNIKVGDRVLVENFRKAKKFDPTFLPSPYKVIEVDEKAKKLTLELGDGTQLVRHPDKVKYYGVDEELQQNLEQDDDWESPWCQKDAKSEEEILQLEERGMLSEKEEENLNEPVHGELRRSERTKS